MAIFGTSPEWYGSDGTLKSIDTEISKITSGETVVGKANAAITTDFTNAAWVPVNDLKNIVVEVGKTYQIRFKWESDWRCILFSVFDLNPRTQPIIGLMYDYYEVAVIHKNFYDYGTDSVHLKLWIHVTGSVSEPVYELTGTQMTGSDISSMKVFRMSRLMYTSVRSGDIKNK